MALPTPAPAIRPEQTEVNILTSADPLPASVASFDRWRTGIAQRELYRVASGSWPVDCVVEDEKAAINWDDQDVYEFVPVAQYVHHGCEGRVDAEAYKAEALAVLDQRTPWLLAKELWTGAVSGNPSLQSTAVDITGFVPSGLSAFDAATILISAWDTTTEGAKAFLHIPQIALYELIDRQFAVRQGNKFVTHNGHVIIPGPGYPTSGDIGPTGSPEPALGQAYFYITGCVEVATHTSFVIGSEDNSVGSYARRNLVEFYAERQSIYRFPTASVLALLCDAGWYTPGS